MTPTHLDIQRDIGRMEGRLDGMDDRLSKIETVVDRVDQRLARMEAAESQRAGAVKFGNWLYGVALAIAGFLAAHFWE